MDHDIFAIAVKQSRKNLMNHSKMSCVNDVFAIAVRQSRKDLMNHGRMSCVNDICDCSQAVTKGFDDLNYSMMSCVNELMKNGIGVKEDRTESCVDNA